MFKKGSTEGLERELRDKRLRLVEEESAAETESRLALTAGDDRLDQATADLLGDRISEAEYAGVEADVDALKRGHSANADRHRRVSRLLTVEIEELERQLAEQPFKELLEKLPELAKAHQAAAAQFAKSLRSVMTSAATLTRRRDELDEAIAAAKDACPPWREFDFAGEDEAAWPVVKELVALLKAGRRDGVAREAERMRRRDEEAKKAAAQRVPNMVAAIVRGGTTAAERQDRFDALTSDERAEVLRQAEASLDKAEADIRREFARAASMPGAPIGGQPLDEEQRVRRVRKTIEQRIEQLRDVDLAPVG